MKRKRTRRRRKEIKFSDYNNGITDIYDSPEDKMVTQVLLYLL